MKIYTLNGKLIFQIGENFYASSFSFSQTIRAGQTFFRIISEGKNLFDYEAEFSTITNEFGDVYARPEKLRNLLISHFGDDTVETQSEITIREATTNETLSAGYYSAISLCFRGNGGTLAGVPVPDGYTANFSKDNGGKLGQINFTAPTTGEARVIYSALD
jgi:hypothetical protein